jgi:hypothetical protein
MILSIAKEYITINRIHAIGGLKKYVTGYQSGGSKLSVIQQLIFSLYII